MFVSDVSERDISGFGVEALDGSIVKVEEATTDGEEDFLVVTTGGLFGKKVMLPAGVIERVDEADEKVWVSRTKEQIKNAPGFDDAVTGDEKYRERLGSYYGPGGAGYRDRDEGVY